MPSLPLLAVIVVLPQNVPAPLAVTVAGGVLIVPVTAVLVMVVHPLLVASI